MLNFAELKSNTGVICQRSSDTSYLTNIGIWLNLGLEYLYNIYDYFPELEDTHTFNTADGTEAYHMPSRFAKFFLSTNNPRCLSNFPSLSPYQKSEMSQFIIFPLYHAGNFPIIPPHISLVKL